MAAVAQRVVKIVVANVVVVLMNVATVVGIVTVADVAVAHAIDVAVSVTDENINTARVVVAATVAVFIAVVMAVVADVLETQGNKDPAMTTSGVMRETKP